MDDLGIDGAFLNALEIHQDDRGSFAELYRRGGIGLRSMVQANLSRSKAGVLRGMHFHRHQADLWIPLAGEASAVLLDLRDGSPTKGRRATAILAAGDPRALSIPPGVAHGFATVEGFTMLYLVDREYDGDDEFGFAWNDPDLGIRWPVATPILSERDRSSPSLAEAVSVPPRFPVEKGS